MGGRRAARVAVGDQSKSGCSSSQSCAPRVSPQPLPLMLPRVLARAAAGCYINIQIILEDVSATQYTHFGPQRGRCSLVWVGHLCISDSSLMSGFWVIYMTLRGSEGTIFAPECPMAMSILESVSALAGFDRPWKFNWRAHHVPSSLISMAGQVQNWTCSLGKTPSVRRKSFSAMRASSECASHKFHIFHARTAYRRHCSEE